MLKIQTAKTVILAGDAALAEKVCERLREPGVYQPLIEAPMVRLVEDGVFENDCVHVGLAIEALKPTTLLYLKVPSDVAQELRRLFPDLTPLVLNDFDPVWLEKYLPLNKRPVNLSDLMNLPGSECSGDVFVIEEDHNFDSVIAANLASAQGGSVLAIPSVSNNELDSLRDALRVWANSNQPDRANTAVLEFIQSRLPPRLITASKLKSISFITKGVPYGILPFNCPTTHYFSFPLLGVAVLAGMLKSHDIHLCPIAVLIDSGTVGQSELETLRNGFNNAGYYSRIALGTQATVMTATYLSQHLPCDFIFYASHCDEVHGQRVVESFPDSEGIEHVICYDRVNNICGSPINGHVELVEMKSPVTLDGVDWSNKAKLTEMNAENLIRDFRAHVKLSSGMPNTRRFLSITDGGKVQYSDSLGMSDGIYIPIPQVVGGHHYPLVFNNACCSWRELAARFAWGGASAYIGTSTKVQNTVAVKIACAFSKAILSGKTAGIALFKAQREFAAKFGYSPYLMHGYLFTSYRRLPIAIRHQRVVSRLSHMRQLYESSPGIYTQAAAVFLNQELNHFLQTM